MKNRILSFLLVAALGISLCACQGANGNNPGSDSGNNGSESNSDKNPLLFEVPEGGYDGSEVTILFDHTLQSRYWDLLDACIAEFNKMYPKIHITHQLVGDYEDIYIQNCTSSAAPISNIVFCRPDQVAGYIDKGMVIALDKLISDSENGYSQAQLEDFVEAFYNQGKEYGDGYMYSLPISKSAEVLYYNKTFFEQHQLNVPKTWDEMEALCEQIKAIDPQAIPLGYERTSNWFVTMTQQLDSGYTSATGERYLFNNAENQNFVKDIQEWYSKGYVTTSFYGELSVVNRFANQQEGGCYMAVSSSVAAKYFLPRPDGDGKYPFEVGIAMVPQADVNNPKVITEGPEVCILKNENPQEVIASWLFVKFLTTNKDFQIAYALTDGKMPVLKSAVEDSRVADYLAGANNTDGIQKLALKQCLEQKNAYFSLPAFITAYDSYKEVGTLLEEAMKSDGDVAGLFEKAVNNLKAKEK